MVFENETIEKELAPDTELYEFEFPFDVKDVTEIKKVGIDCSCTRIVSPQAGDKFDAGASGKLKGLFDPSSKTGEYVGKIKVSTNFGDKILMLKFKVNKLVTLGRLTSFLGTKKEDEIRIKTYFPSSSDNFEIVSAAPISAEVKKDSDDGRSFSLVLKNEGTLEKREKITLAYVLDGKRREFVIHAMPF